MATTSRAPNRGLSFLAMGHERLDALWQAIFSQACPDAIRQRFSRMLSPWGARPMRHKPAWPSDIGDDHSPFEFSLVVGAAAPELRVLVEAQGEQPTAASTCQAALDLSDALQRDGADLARLRAVQEIFLQDAPGSKFSLWHAASLAPDKPHYKAYLNPRLHDAASSFEVAESALRRLALDAVVPALHAARFSPHDDVRYFALDLHRTTKSRVKVYLYQPGATTAHFERLAAMAPQVRRGQATELCELLTGGFGPYTAHPLCSYLSFVEGSPEPYEVTIQVPIRFYCRDDLVARARICALFDACGLDSAPYQNALDAMARRPLSRNAGLNTYVSLRLGESSPRIGVYLAIEAYSVEPRRSSGIRRT